MRCGRLLSRCSRPPSRAPARAPFPTSSAPPSPPSSPPWRSRCACGLPPSTSFPARWTRESCRRRVRRGAAHRPRSCSPHRRGLQAWTVTLPPRRVCPHLCPACAVGAAPRRSSAPPRHRAPPSTCTRPPRATPSSCASACCLAQTPPPPRSLPGRRRGRGNGQRRGSSCGKDGPARLERAPRLPRRWGNPWPVRFAPSWPPPPSAARRRHGTRGAAARGVGSLPLLPSPLSFEPWRARQ